MACYRYSFLPFLHHSTSLGRYGSLLDSSHEVCLHTFLPTQSEICRRVILLLLNSPTINTSGWNLHAFANQISGNVGTWLSKDASVHCTFHQYVSLFVTGYTSQLAVSSGQSSWLQNGDVFVLPVRYELNLYSMLCGRK
jgi:hypothetical protein